MDSIIRIIQEIKRRRIANIKQAQKKGLRISFAASEDKAILDFILSLQISEEKKKGSVWHLPTDVPQERGEDGERQEIAVLLPDKRIRLIYAYLYNADDVVTWAYVKDLLPTNIKL